MKKFKLVYWNECGEMEISEEKIMEFENGEKVLEYLIEEKLKNESWIEEVNKMFNYEGEEKNWVNEKSEWNMFVVGGNLEDKIFDVDFCNEFESCVVVREDHELFDKKWNCDMISDLV